MKNPTTITLTQTVRYFFSLRDFSLKLIFVVRFFISTNIKIIRTTPNEDMDKLMGSRMPSLIEEDKTVSTHENP